MPGIAPNTHLRLVPDPEPGLPKPADVQVEVDDGGDIPQFDGSDNVIRIAHGDGSITLSLDGKPIDEHTSENKAIGWFDNLAEHIDASTLSSITDDLIRGIEQDLQSREEWIQDRAEGVKLLGLKIELPQQQGGTDGAPVEGMSKVRHPLLLEAVLRFQANGRSEFLPTDGPVKIRNDSTTPSGDQDLLANALEQDLNHYLTSVATEYYPDTDRMLFMLGFGGSGFKKVYMCPLRGRPVSESVDADDLIVNQAATDLANAQRITHRVMMRNSTVKRMQILDVYRDIALGQAQPRKIDPLREQKSAQQGITVDTDMRPEDREREIYECYCELDIPGFEHKMGSKITGLPVPYVVTIDLSSREALAVTRNYGEDDKPLPIARKRFVKYSFVPGLGFYDIGLLNILGNTTNAVTAAWREMLDCGMFASFPGFLIEDNGGRQNTNIFRVPPGGAAPIKTNGRPIKDMVMNLPYSTQGMQATMALVENMAETGRRLGGTAEVQVGEGRADVPVGTVMAMIDQAIKVMNAVHKRVHTAQAEEFQLLKDIFRDHPESIIGRKCRSKTKWDKEKFLTALNDCDLVPQADPNTSSTGQRIMKVWAALQLSQQYQTLYDPIKTNTKALMAIGWPNPEEFFVPPSARAQPPPQLIQAQSEMKVKQQAADAKTTEAQARATEAGAKQSEVQAKTEQGFFSPKPEAGGVAAAPEPESTLDQATAQAKLMDAHTNAARVGLDARKQAIDERNDSADREAKERESIVGLAKEVIVDPQDATGAGKKATKIMDQIDHGLKGPSA